jgi:hypothetical protein
LAAWAEVRAALTHLDALNGHATAWTGFPYPSIDRQPTGELTEMAIGLLVRPVRERRAAADDGCPQHRLDGSMQSLHLDGGQLIGPAQGVNASPPQRLIRVDVAQAGQEALI